MADSGAVKLKAGANVSTALTSAQYTQLINQAESYVNLLTRINYTDTYSGLNDDKKKILEEAVSCHAATAAINYDMSGYTSRQEVLNMLNLLWARLVEAIKLLKGKDQQAFVSEA